MITALEDRLEALQLFQGQIGAQVLVTGQFMEGGQQVIVPTLAVSSCELLVAFQGQFILLLATNLPGMRHQFAMLTHGQARALLAIARQFRLQVMGAQGQ
ncbi:hypothetical protein D3C76_1196510 [compost metagenome]